MGSTHKLLKLFSENLMAHLQQKSWNQRILAQKTGMTQSRISLYMNCQASPGLEAIEAIADALEVPAAELFADPDVESENENGGSFAALTKALKVHREWMDQVENVAIENARLRQELRASQSPDAGKVIGIPDLTKRERRLMETFREQPAHLQLAIELLATGDRKLLEQAGELGLEPGEIEILRSLVALS